MLISQVKNPGKERIDPGQHFSQWSPKVSFACICVHLPNSLSFSSLSSFLEPKSKRQSTKLRSKIAKKSREHHRKQRRDTKTSGHQKRARKDPGVPALFPLREVAIAKMRAEFEKEISQKAARKAALKESIAASAMMVEDESEQEDLENLSEKERLAHMVQCAESAQNEFAPEQVIHNAQAASPNQVDNSRRAFYKEFKEVLEAADVILEVLDARDPLGCRVREVEEAVLATGGTKRLVLVLNKTDLVPRDVVQDWIKYLQREFPCVAFKASTQEGRTNLSQSGNGSSSEAFGADGLIQLLKNYARSASKKLRVRVGVVGFPNVGKSSLINSLKRSRVCKVGAAPGVTTAKQEIHLDSTVSLLDCPGIVFAADEAKDAAMMLRNCLKVEQLADPITPALLAISKIPRESFQKLYLLADLTGCDESNILNQLARRLGKLRRGGVPDLEATARHLLNDWNAGKISYFTPVPTDRPHLASGAEVVQSFSPAMNIFGQDEGVMEVDAHDNDNGNENDKFSKFVSVMEKEESIESAEESVESVESDEDLAASFDPSSHDNPNLQLNQQRARLVKLAQKKAAKEARRQMRD